MSTTSVSSSGEYSFDTKPVNTQSINSNETQSSSSSLGSPLAAGPFFGVIRAHRIFTRRFNVSGVNRNSTVFVSLTEVAQSSSGVLDIPFIGNATMKLYNVSPRDDSSVDVRGEIDWNSDLNIRISFFVF